VTKENRPPRTFVELVLQLLEDRFPWLGKTTDEQISGADTVDQLTDLYRELKSRRRTSQRNDRKSGN
jgi:transcriptional accessory protein Tex/SPT6